VSGDSSRIQERRRYRLRHPSQVINRSKLRHVNERPIAGPNLRNLCSWLGDEGTRMKEGSQVAKLAPRIAAFLAGTAAVAWTLARKPGARTDPEVIRELQKAIADLETRLIAQESAAANRFTQIESRLDEHAVKLAETPSTAQIVAAMELLLSKTMATLDGRLTAQSQSIEVLKTTISQTDSVLERILESLDTLQTDPEPQPGESALLELTM
jgi:hypothetical protein